MTADEKRELAIEQMVEAGLWGWVTGTLEPDGSGYRSFLALPAITDLRRDARFVEGPWSALHAADVGGPRTEFRSARGSLGRGSLQVVVNMRTGRCYFDVDRFSPYDDVVGAVGHLFGEVVPSAAKRAWAWFKGTFRD